MVEAKKGESLVLKLVNVDAMPHNLVIVKPGSTETVGDASFKMLNDPKAGEKNYVPDLSEVLHFVPVIDPNTQHSLHFTAPKEAGDYPFICTFPGHWIAMQNPADSIVLKLFGLLLKLSVNQAQNNFTTALVAAELPGEGFLFSPILGTTEIN